MTPPIHRTENFVRNWYIHWEYIWHKVVGGVALWICEDPLRQEFPLEHIFISLLRSYVLKEILVRDGLHE